MFKTNISNPINPIPIEYINTLDRLGNEPDYSLTCFGIALLKKRCDYHGIHGRYFIEPSLMSCYNMFIENRESGENKIHFDYYIYTTNDDVNGDETLKKLGYKRKEPIEKLILDKASNHCFAYYNENENSAAIFIDTRDIRLYHLLISFIPLYFPLLFKEMSMQPEEYEIIKTLSKNDSDDFISKISESVKPYTEEFRRLQLTEVLFKMHEMKVDSARRNVNDRKNEMQSYYESYLCAVQTLKDAIVQYEGLKATECSDGNEKELIDYLCQNPNILNVTLEGNVLMFNATSYLVNYNEDAWKLMDERGGIYDGSYNGSDRRANICSVFESRLNRKRLLNAIFGEDPEFAVKMCGHYRLNLYDYGVHTRSSYNYTENEPILKSYVPNPHLQIHGCLGGYQTRITNKVCDGDYVCAIEMCIASAGSVNLDETDLTFRPFIGMILSSKEKILHRKDGVDMTPEEALVYLADKEKEKENEADHSVE